MAAGFIGLDPQRLQSEFIPKIDAAHTNVQDVITSVGSVVASSIGPGLIWNGDDAEAFKNAWETEKIKLQAVLTTLEDAKAKVQANITEQTTAASGSGGQFTVA
jgi:hypothetical protein